MSKKILITDDLFIFGRHETILRGAGYTDLLRIGGMASEDELCEAIRGAEGYILGGIETVTSRVIEAGAPTLRAIAFTGAGYREFIPGHEEATARGIKITNAPGANASSVAEFTLSLILPMIRRIPELVDPNGIKAFEAPDFEDLTVAVVGYGQIGKRVAKLAKALGLNVVIVARSNNEDNGGFEQISLDDLPTRANVVTLHVSKEYGENVLDADLIERLRPNTIIINAAFPEAVDKMALARRLRAGELRAAFDRGMEVNLSEVPAGHYIASKVQSGFYSTRALQRTSDMATQSLLNVLTTGTDTFVVN